MSAFLPQSITEVPREGTDHHLLVHGVENIDRLHDLACFEWAGTLRNPLGWVDRHPSMPQQCAYGCRHAGYHLVPVLVRVGRFRILIQLVP